MSEYISKEEALKIVGFEESWLSDTNKSAYDVEIAFHGLKKKIESAPSADVRENIHGHWIDTDEWRETVDGFEQWGYFHKCSKCGYVFKFLEINNFCPNCGADMREPKGEKGET